MAKRWYISPIVVVDGVRKAKAAATPDGRPPYDIVVVDDDGVVIGTRTIVPTYDHKSTIYLQNWCVSLIEGNDFTPLESDPEIFSLGDLDRTKKPPGATGNKLRQAARDRGMDISHLGSQATYDEWIRTFGKALKAGFDPDRMPT